MTEQEWLDCNNSRWMLDFLASPDPMIDRQVIIRKVALFACACCRSLDAPSDPDGMSDLFDQLNLRRLLSVAEQFAVGKLPPKNLLQWQDTARDVWKQSRKTYRQSENNPSYHDIEDSLFCESAVLLTKAIYRMFAMFEQPERITTAAKNISALAAKAYGCSTQNSEAILGADLVDEGELEVQDFFDKMRNYSREKVEQGAKKGNSRLLRDIFGTLPFRRSTISPSVLAWGDSALPKLAREIYDNCAFNRLRTDLADILQVAGCKDTDIISHCLQTSKHFRGCWVLDLLLGYP